MSYNTKLIQSRPNTGVEFFSPTAAVVSKLNEFKTSGAIISMNLNAESENGLQKTMSIVYRSVEDFNTVIADPVVAASSNERINHCSTNKISFDLQLD